MKKKIYKWIIGKFVIYGTGGFFKIAYEHGLEKAGYKQNAVPMWDEETYIKATSILRILIKERK